MFCVEGSPQLYFGKLSWIEPRGLGYLLVLTVGRKFVVGLRSDDIRGSNTEIGNHFDENVLKMLREHHKKLTPTNIGRAILDTCRLFCRVHDRTQYKTIPIYIDFEDSLTDSAFRAAVSKTPGLCLFLENCACVCDWFVCSQSPCSLDNDFSFANLR